MTIVAPFPDLDELITSIGEAGRRVWDIISAYLSHIQTYQDEKTLNTRLLRWQPEAIVNLPEGLGMVPFSVPGSPELMAATYEYMNLVNHNMGEGLSSEEIREICKRLEIQQDIF